MCEDVDEDGPPQDGRVVGDDDDDDFPLREGSSLETAVLCPECTPLIFF